LKKQKTKKPHLVAPPPVGIKGSNLWNFVDRLSNTNPVHYS